MGLFDKLGQASNYLRKLRLSLGPDSYFQYKRQRRDARKQAEHAREQAAARERDETEDARESAAREHEYDERYVRERKGDVAPEHAEQAEPNP